MVDITEKKNSLRHARARATVQLSSKEAMKALINNEVPKGNVFESARIAALYAAKKTAEMIPDCHPLPVEYTAVHFNTSGLDIECEVEIKTIYKTGVEVEAMHAASVAALTIYDMMKPLDKEIHIKDIHLLWKKGGKSDRANFLPEEKITAQIIICSDSISEGEAEDKSGAWLEEHLPEYNIEVSAKTIIPDEPAIIRRSIESSVENAKLVILSGGTGAGARDNTSAVLNELLEKKLEGISELARVYSNERMPYAFLSNSCNGLYKSSLILSMPGSKGGVKDFSRALFPEVLHVFKLLEKEFRH